MSKSNSKLGFTLVELLIVIAIMSTLAAIIFPKISLYSSVQTLNESASSFVSIIRATQANALSGTLCGDQFNPLSKANYWGFYADPSSSTYSYKPYCVNSSGSFLSLIPETDFSYSTGITLTQVTLMNSSNVEICSPSISTEVIGFSNISANVQFLNIDETGHITSDTCQDSQTPNLQKIRYTLSSYGAPIYVFADRSGSIFSSQTPIPPTP